MNGNDEISSFIEERLLTCRVKRRSYDLWLATLDPTNLLTVAAPAVLSVIAGSTILTEPVFLGPDRGRLIAGVCALASAVLTTIHKTLNCDAHQSECRRIMQAYSALETSYERLKKGIIPTGETKEGLLLKLDTRLEQIKQGAGSRPPEQYLRKAQRELSKG